MDIHSQVAAAITAVAPGDPDAWFAAVRGAYDDLAESGGQVDWDAFKAALVARAEADGVQATLVDGFVEAMEANDPAPIDTVAKLRELGNTLPVLYLEQAAALAGTEPTWEPFKQWFLYEANQKGVAIPANQFVIYAESQGDEVATFAQYGVHVGPVAVTSSGAAGQAEQPAVDTSAFPAVQEGDSGEWVRYLDEMLKSKGF